MKAFHAKLYAWYAAHGRRELPWRATEDPYAIYVSEVMLQQTQVSVVRDRYYAPFLARFPTLSALAEAPLEDALKAWEGMGYYRRVRQMHEAARRSAPALPRNVEGLMRLPGVGRNTAHAVAAFAYRLPAPVMEANVRRVLHRLLARPSIPEKELWEIAAARLDRQDPFTYNQAMMDIGALLCAPRQPSCHACPLASGCKGKERPEAYPAPVRRKAPPVRRRVILAPRSPDGRYYLAPRAGALLGGLYGFPEYGEDAPSPPAAREWGEESPATTRRRIGSVTHVYSHFRLEADVYLLPVAAPSGDGWRAAEDIARLPLSAVDKKVMRLLASDAA